MAFQRILLTGGAGFVGAHLAAALASAYPQARKAMLLRPGEKDGHPAFQCAEADLVDEPAIDSVVARLAPDLVIHLAGQASIGDAAKAAELTWRTNFHGSFALGAAIARHAPGATMLFASTAAVYGLSFRQGVLNEDAPLQPLDVYSRTKAAAESALADVLGPAARLIVARPVNHSGAGQKSRSFVLSSFAAQIVAIETGEAEPRLRVGDLSKARDFLDVRDVVDAYMRLIAAAPDLPARCAFNIGSGEARTILSLLDELRAMARRDFAVEVNPALLRPSATDIPCVACDAAKLTSITGWRPQFTPRDMLQAILEDWRAQHSRPA
jgi:GDP-4-dehydro-6-deoxy-D-mannose reductase